jgi:phospholipid/cholesterol/gamma-HCH transport system substrate-binding protein
VTRRSSVQIRRYGRHFLTLVALAAIGTAAGFYILIQQRLPNPFQSFYSVNGAFTTAAGVVPGLGEPVNVAGVHVGEISGTSLHDGQAVIHMQIDPSKIARLYSDAHADLVPNTPLMDMQVDIAPGDPSAGPLPSGGTIPVAQTVSPASADELLGALDADTRSWLVSLITELNEATSGRAQDIRALLGSLGPTSMQLQQVGDLLAGRHDEVARIVHNLGVLTRAVSAKDAQLATFVRTADDTVQAFARQDTALSASISALPPTLQTTQKTLRDLIPFSNALGATATALLPTARSLPGTLRDTHTLLSGAALLPLKQIRPFVAAVRPLANQLPALAGDLRTEAPALTDSFKVLSYVTNELAYDSGGGNPGFLYWLAWFAHNSDSFISNSDANGPAWRSLLVVTCPALKSLSSGPILEDILGTNFGCS